MRANSSVRDNMRVSFTIFAWEAIPIVVCTALGAMIGDFAGLVVGLVVGAVIGTAGLAVALVRAAAKDRRAGTLPGAPGHR